MKLLMMVTFALALFPSSCVNVAGEWHYEEIGRVKSPDGVVDAVLVRGNGGATTSFTYSVFIVSIGAAFDEKSPLFDFNKKQDLFGTDTKEFQLAWNEPRSLEIRYRSIPRIFHYRNFWQSPDVQNNYVVDVRLVQVRD